LETVSLSKTTSFTNLEGADDLVLHTVQLAICFMESETQA
jgi:hypothetical protein